MTTPSRDRVIDVLLERHGRTFASEAAIRLDRNTPAPLFRLLVMSLLVSARISSTIAIDATKALSEAGWTTPDKLLRSTWEQRTKVLNRAGYARYDESTARYLEQTTTLLVERYDGDLRNLRDAAGRDPSVEHRLLTDFTGIGDVGAHVFLREAQVVWSELDPYVDDRILETAAALSLPDDRRLAPSCGSGRRDVHPTGRGARQGRTRRRRTRGDRGVAAMSERLDEYRAKRDFDRTAEPSGSTEMPSSEGPPRFVIQHHDASREHYDFRLEADGVLLSWAVPKGPSTDPRDKRLAVRTEDHPVDYIDFEGTIPSGEYGGGAVIVWDVGTWEHVTTDDDGEPIAVSEALDGGHVSFRISGQKLRGGYTLQRFRPEHDQWLLVKQVDDDADARRRPTSTQPESVLSGYTVEQVADMMERDE